MLPEGRAPGVCTIPVARAAGTRPPVAGASATRGEEVPDQVRDGIAQAAPSSSTAVGTCRAPGPAMCSGVRARAYRSPVARTAGRSMQRATQSRIAGVAGIWSPNQAKGPAQSRSAALKSSPSR